LAIFFALLAIDIRITEPVCESCLKDLVLTDFGYFFSGFGYETGLLGDEISEYPYQMVDL